MVRKKKVSKGNDTLGQCSLVKGPDRTFKIKRHECIQFTTGEGKEKRNKTRKGTSHSRGERKGEGQHSAPKGQKKKKNREGERCKKLLTGNKWQNAIAGGQTEERDLNKRRKRKERGNSQKKKLALCTWPTSLKDNKSTSTEEGV